MRSQFAGQSPVLLPAHAPKLVAPEAALTSTTIMMGVAFPVSFALSCVCSRGRRGSNQASEHRMAVMGMTLGMIS